MAKNPMKYEIQKEETLFDEFFTILKARLRFEQFDGKMSSPVNRYSFQKSDAAAVLVYHIEENAYILVRQFRFPPVHHDIDPWFTEIVAGGIEEGEDQEEAARREVEEEVGYRALKMHRITNCYVSPGLMNERVAIFMAEVDETSRVNSGGGAKHEDEDIELIRIPANEAMQWIADQEVGDAKTILAIQWHQLQK